MLYLSEILMQHHEIESFEDLVAVVRARGASGERFFQIDVKPEFAQLPRNWEETLEAAFTAYTPPPASPNHNA